jgi:hypothetical protein
MQKLASGFEVIALHGCPKSEHDLFAFFRPVRHRRDYFTAMAGKRNEYENEETSHHTCN